MTRRTNGEGSIFKRTGDRPSARYTFNGKRRDITGKTQAEFTGLREGELLGLRWMDIDLNSHNPLIHALGTL